jgi:predicted transposase YdaD
LSLDVHHPHDRGLKLIFSHAVMIEALLRGFVSEEWVDELDFSSLTPVNVAHITDDLRSRDDDVIWRIYFNNTPIYIVCVLEFQSTVEEFMAARILTYAGLIYQDLIAQKDPLVTNRKKLPPLFPIVFHTGSKPWNAPLRLKDCLVDNIPGALGKYQPNIQYLILDVGRLRLDKYPAKDDNLVVPLMELERVDVASEAIPVVSRLADMLKGSEFDSLRRAYLIYIKKALKFDVICPEVEITELQEVNTMLAEKFERWILEYKQEGREEGREEAHEEYRQKLLHVLERLLKIQGQIMTKEHKASLSCASLDEIQKHIDVILNNELIEV